MGEPTPAIVTAGADQLSWLLGHFKIPSPLLDCMV